MEFGWINVFGVIIVILILIPNIVDTKTAKSAMMISPGGFGINLIEHKK